jgi:hypothetical protein
MADMYNERPHVRNGVPKTPFIPIKKCTKRFAFFALLDGLAELGCALYENDTSRLAHSPSCSCSFSRSVAPRSVSSALLLVSSSNHRTESTRIGVEPCPMFTIFTWETMDGIEFCMTSSKRSIIGTKMSGLIWGHSLERIPLSHSTDSFPRTPGTRNR